MTPPKTDNAIQEVFPYLRVRDAKGAIEFYKRAFGAEELFRLTEPSGRIGHVQLKFGAALVMLCDEYPERGILSPLSLGGTGFSLHLHVLDVDAMTQRAVECGAKLLAEPKNQFYGERSSRVLDPYGHEWMLGQSIENVSTDEMQRRYMTVFSSK
jgi:PhnB protein